MRVVRVRVARVRPALASEVSQPAGVETQADGKTLLLSDGKQQRQFAFDAFSRHSVDPAIAPAQRQMGQRKGVAHRRQQDVLKNSVTTERTRLAEAATKSLSPEEAAARAADAAAQAERLKREAKAKKTQEAAKQSWQRQVPEIGRAHV